MNDESALLASVREWLERGGYVLELEVARALNRWGAVVDQGYHYTDPVSGKDREGDLRAWVPLNPGSDGDGPLHRLQLFIECKATNAPWIFFVGEASGAIGPWQPGRNTQNSCGICESTLAAVWEMGRAQHVAYAVTEKHNASAADHAYQAVQQVTSSVIAEYIEDIHWAGHDTLLGETTDVAMPVVVTTSPLIACALDYSGGVTLREVDRILIRATRTEVPAERGDGIHVAVVRAAALESLLGDVKAEILTAST